MKTEKLKNVTQQKRVELIEKQKWGLIAATETIDNLNLEVKDLTERNGNLRELVNTNEAKIKWQQNDINNLKSVIALLESNNETLHKKLAKSEESRERLASKFTNWFIFLVVVSFGSIALNVYQYFK